MKKANTVSEFQKMFSTQQTFKRNRQYYDAIRMRAEEHVNQLRRRKPQFVKKHQAKAKIEQTFQSAEKEAQNKIDEGIEKYKFRLSFYNSTQANPENQSTRYKNSSPQDEPQIKNIKGVSHQKLQSREQIYHLKNKPTIDERQFNNFYITKNNLDHTPKLGNYSPRQMNIALEHMTDLYYDSQNKYEEVYFDQRVNSCIFDLKKQNDQKKRYFFIPQREENKAAIDLKPENVAKSFSVANPYKTNKILNFYRINGRQLPSQFDQRLLSPNKNFYKNNQGKLVKQYVSFTARKYKDQLIERDLQQIKSSKRPYFNRDQVCDQLYFKQEKRMQQN